MSKEYFQGYEDATTIKNVEIDRLRAERIALKGWLREIEGLLEMSSLTIVALEGENEELRKQLGQWMGRTDLIQHARHQSCA